METIFINDFDIREFGIEGIRSYKVGGTPITNEYFQGKNRTNYLVLDTTFGLKSVQFELLYKSHNRRDLLLLKSKIEAKLFDVCELYMPDGFYYRSILESISEGEFQGVEDNEVILLVAYKFNGIQHDKLVKTTSGSFICEATMPKMDCSLTVTVGETASSYVLGGVTFSSVSAGDVLTVDGINKRILKNGAPTTFNGYFEFPYVVNGQNNFTALDTVTVEYYPCYI